MLLAIDIGNTSINLGLFRGKRLFKKFAIPTARRNYSPALKKFLAKNHNSIDETIISSVVPTAAKNLSRDLFRLLKKKPRLIGKDLRVPIRNLYRRPAQVGQDRLVNAYAASRLYGAPAVVVDFGTAITFDIISKNKAYLGGMILPGLGISLDALYERTALLPKIELGRPREFIGRDTRNSMLSGIIYGFAALTDDMTDRIRKKIGKNARVIGTGGNISLIAKFCRNLEIIDPDLTLKGISLLKK